MVLQRTAFVSANFQLVDEQKMPEIFLQESLAGWHLCPVHIALSPFIILKFTGKDIIWNNTDFFFFILEKVVIPPRYFNTCSINWSHKARQKIILRYTHYIKSLRQEIWDKHLRSQNTDWERLLRCDKHAIRFTVGLCTILNTNPTQCNCSTMPVTHTANKK